MFGLFVLLVLVCVLDLFWLLLLFVFCPKTQTKIQTKTKTKQTKPDFPKTLQKPMETNNKTQKTKPQATMSEYNVWKKLVVEVWFISHRVTFSKLHYNQATSYFRVFRSTIASYVISTMPPQPLSLA